MWSCHALSIVLLFKAQIIFSTTPSRHPIQYLLTMEKDMNMSSTGNNCNNNKNILSEMPKKRIAHDTAMNSNSSSNTQFSNNNDNVVTIEIHTKTENINTTMPKVVTNIMTKCAGGDEDNGLHCMVGTNKLGSGKIMFETVVPHHYISSQFYASLFHFFSTN